MPLAPGPSPVKFTQYTVLHLVSHAKLLKKCSEEWYWCDNFGKFFHSCTKVKGHQLEVHEYGDLGCYKCGEQLPDAMK